MDERALRLDYALLFNAQQGHGYESRRKDKAEHLAAQPEKNSREGFHPS